VRVRVSLSACLTFVRLRRRPIHICLHVSCVCACLRTCQNLSAGVKQISVCLLVVWLPVLPVETEREKEAIQQLEEANGTAARLQDELRLAIDREAQLDMQLEKMNEEVTRLRKQTDQSAVLEDELRLAVDRETNLEMELDKMSDEITRLRKTSDASAVLEDELSLAVDREIQLEMQLGKTKMQLDEESQRRHNLQKEFDDFRKRNTLLLEEQMKHHDSMLHVLHYVTCESSRH